MATTRSFTLWKTHAESASVVSSRNQRSTRLSHEALVSARQSVDAWPATPSRSDACGSRSCRGSDGVSGSARTRGRAAARTGGIRGSCGAGNTDDRPVEDLQRGKERGCPVPLVIMGHRAAAPLLERQPRLRAIQRLNLALLVDAEHDRLVGRVEVEAHEVSFSTNRMSVQFEGPGCGCSPWASQIRCTVAGLRACDSSNAWRRAAWFALSPSRCA